MIPMKNLKNIVSSLKYQVNRLLVIFRLPEKYQNYLWAGVFAYQKYEYLYGKGVLNAKTFSYEKDVTEIIDKEKKNSKEV